MGQKKNSIRFIISISFIVLIITTFSVVGIFVFHNWKGSALDIVRKMENDTNKSILQKMNELTSVPLDINAANHNLIQKQVINLKDKNQREMFFASVIKSSNEEVYSFSYGAENGEYYGARRNSNNEIEIIENNAATNGKSFYYSTTEALTAGKLVEETSKFDCRSRDWYIAAKEKGQPVISPIYKHFVMDDLAISAAYPIYAENGKFEGVLGTHIILSRINDYLKEAAKENNATVYIIEKSSGALVGNSAEKKNFKTLKDNQIKRITLDEIDNKSIKDAYANYRKNSSNSFEIKEGKDKLHITFTNFEKVGLDWVIVTAIPENQFTAEVSKNIQISILLSIIALAAAIGIYIKSTRAVLKPIYNLINTAKKFSEGDFSERAKVYRNDEIANLSDAFNNMAESLNMLINNLEEKVTERTAELEKANIALKESEEDLNLLFNSTAEAIYGIDREGNCTFCNDSCIRMLRYKKNSELIGKNMHNMIHHKRSDGTPLALDQCQVFNAFLKGEGTHIIDEVLWRADGTSFPVECFSYPQYRNGEIIGAVVTFMDISERKKSEEEILYLSYHDQLTGLYNRRYFEEELIRLDAPEFYPLTIVMSDMNGLKLINDSLGHAIGDELIRKVAKVLMNGCRKDDVVARLGGDEFVILMPKTEPIETERIIKEIKKLASKEKVGTIDISISFGYETKNHEEDSIQDILKKAEDYMYKKKLFEGPSMRGKTIKTIISTLHEKNEREEAHSHRVSELCKSMGEALELSESGIKELQTVGLLHDIGKIAVQDSILNKPGKLTDEEWEEIKRHPEVGYRILNTVNDMSEMARYVLGHHERWDGRGYPKGLKELEIPLQSRIITIADAYDAMTSSRSYRDASPEEWAIEQLKRNAGSQFDPDLVKIFIEKVLGKSMN